MADQFARHRLQRKLEEILGPDEAATLMEHLPPDRWDELARQRDVLALRRDLDAVKQDVGVLKQDVKELRSDLGAFRTEVDLRFEAVEHRIVGVIRGEMHTLISANTRNMVFALVGAITANSMLVLAAARL